MWNNARCYIPKCFILRLVCCHSVQRYLNVNTSHKVSVEANRWEPVSSDFSKHKPVKMKRPTTDSDSVFTASERAGVQAEPTAAGRCQEWLLHPPVLLAVHRMCAVYSVTKGKYRHTKRIRTEEHVRRCLLSPNGNVFADCSWESRSGEWSSRIRHKNFWEKWVERMRNRCFDNLCQMFSQRPASDLKCYADVGFGLQ